MPDDDLFAKAMRGVTPLNNNSDQYFFKPEPKLVSKPELKFSKISTQQKTILVDNEFGEVVTSEQILTFKQQGLRRQTFKSLQQGKINIDNEIDLHGLIVDKARYKLYWFLQSAYKQQQRCVLVIHGKGKNSQNLQPILKNRVNDWLRQLDLVLAFCSAQNKHGGTGAVYVYLRKISNRN